MTILENEKSFIALNDHGCFVQAGSELIDIQEGRKGLENMIRTEKGGYRTQMLGLDYWVEATIQPYVAKNFIYKQNLPTIVMPYDFQIDFDLESLAVDDWDCFHGRASNQIPFVFSRQAQAQFFDCLDSFDDHSITFHGKKIPVPQVMRTTSVSDLRESKFWDLIYLADQKPGWDLHQSSPAITQYLPKLKLPRQRVIVLGAGFGHDAAAFAQAGHIVTLVDFSAQAVAGAKERYQHLKNIDFVQADIFNLPKSFFGNFDLVFEQTCFCAVDPNLRQDLVRIWSKLLVPKGHLFGVFFVTEARQGPPFGSSEWEIRKRLGSGFDFLIWERFRDSTPDRLGRELLLYAQKKSN